MSTKKALIGCILCFALMGTGCSVFRYGRVNPAQPPPTPTPYARCSWQWANENLPDLSADVQTTLDNAQIATLTVRAYAFGENCIDSQTNTVSYFAAMETDFQIVLPVADLADHDALGTLTADLLRVLNTFTPDTTPGPQPGRYELTFQAGDDALGVMVPVPDAVRFVDEGLTGAALWEAITAP